MSCEVPGSGHDSDQANLCCETGASPSGGGGVSLCLCRGCALIVPVVQGGLYSVTNCPTGKDHAEVCPVALDELEIAVVEMHTEAIMP